MLFCSPLLLLNNHECDANWASQVIISFPVWVVCVSISNTVLTSLGRTFARQTRICAHCALRHAQYFKKRWLDENLCLLNVNSFMRISLYVPSTFFADASIILRHQARELFFSKCDIAHTLSLIFLQKLADFWINFRQILC